MAGNGHHGIPDQLARAVIGDISAPIDRLDLGSAGERRTQQVGAIGAHTERVHVVVLLQEQPVVRTAHEGPLQRVGVVVAGTAQPANPQ